MQRFKLPIIAIMLLCAVFYSHAQDQESQKRWIPSHASLNLSSFTQYYPEMDYQNLLSITQQEIVLPESLMDLEKSEFFDANIYGSKLGVSYGLIKNSDAKWKREVVINARLQFGSEVYLEYYEKGNNNEIAFCLVENSVELELAHMFRNDRKALSFYAGPSIGLGTSFNDELIIFRYNPALDAESSYAVKSSMQLVGHINAGAYLNIYKGFGMRMAAQVGCGYSVRDGFQNVMDRSFSLGYGIEYKFNREKYMN